MFRFTSIAAVSVMLGTLFLHPSTTFAASHFTNECTFQLSRAARGIDRDALKALIQSCVDRAVARNSHNMSHELKYSITWCRKERPKDVPACLGEVFKDGKKFETAFKQGETIYKARQQQRGGVFGRYSRRSRPAGPKDLTRAIAQRLARVLKGRSVADLSIGSLHPGIAYTKAKAIVGKEWALKGGAGADVFKEFTTTRRQMNRYKQRYGRDGGIMKFATMSGTVGDVVFVEHYTGTMNAAAIQSALVKRYGKPDHQQQKGKALEMDWAKGDQELRISIGNRVTEFSRSRQGFWSSVVVDLRSDDYSEYLDKAKRRCARLRNKPMNQLSVNDKMALLHGCLTP